MNLQKLGKTLRTKRQNNNLSSAQTAIKLGLTAPYYSRLENGKEKPSPRILLKIAEFYRLPQEDQQLLEQLAGYGTGSETESDNTDPKIPANTQVMIKLDPQKLPVLFSDTMFISVSENGVVFDFGQKVASINEQHIVARVGVSLSHAKKIRDLLSQQIKNAKDTGIEN